MSTVLGIRDLGLPPLHKPPVSAERVVLPERRNGFFIAANEEEEEEEDGGGVSSDSSSIGPVSSSSSSIGEESSSGAAGEGEGEGEEEEVQSQERKVHGLGSLESLEDSLPIKKGLSSFYAGKSKSFTSLAVASSSEVKDIAKPDNPYNKRRRVLAAWSRRASCSSLVTATSSSLLPPLFAPDLTVAEEDEGESEGEDDDDDVKVYKHKAALLPPLGTQSQKKGAMSTMTMRTSFRSPRSFSLSDLQNAN